MEIDNDDNLDDLSLKLEEMDIEVEDVENIKVLKERSDKVDEKIKEKEKHIKAEEKKN